MKQNVILRAFLFYVVLSTFCLLMWLMFGFSMPVLVSPVSKQYNITIIDHHNTSFNHAVGHVINLLPINKTAHSLSGTVKVRHPIASCEQLGSDISSFKKRKRVTIHDPPIEASCRLLFTGNKQELSKIKARKRNWKGDISDEEYMENLHRNCKKVRQEFNDNFYSSETEKSFPVAFEMLIYYKEGRIQQYIRLLKFLYRSHNAYCIHIDKKSPMWWQDHIVAFASCFPNIIIAKNPVTIKYATATILHAHLRCLNDLLHSRFNWNYVITLHATELPLVTNREMVERLKLLNGSNFITIGERADASNSQVHSWMTYKVKSVNKGTWVVLSEERLDKVPHDIVVYKSGSSANSALSRQFVEFLLSDKKVADLLTWLKDVHSAVEFFFSTVNQMLGAPGHSDIIDELAHREWSHSIFKNRRLCVELKIVHDICIVSAGDLPRLTKLSKHKTHWFFNKYFISYDHVVMDCMEELLLQRNVIEYEQDCGNPYS